MSVRLNCIAARSAIGWPSMQMRPGGHPRLLGGRRHVHGFHHVLPCAGAGFPSAAAAAPLPRAIAERQHTKHAIGPRAMLNNAAHSRRAGCLRLSGLGFRHPAGPATTQAGLLGAAYTSILPILALSESRVRVRRLVRLHVGTVLQQVYPDRAACSAVSRLTSRHGGHGRLRSLSHSTDGTDHSHYRLLTLVTLEWLGPLSLSHSVSLRLLL